VKGRTLASVMEYAQTPIRGELLNHWVTTLLELVQPLHAHYPPVIHRDITPSNIIVDMKDLSLYLIDTSSACLMGQEKRVVGHPIYAPREQLRGQAVPASDIYSIVAVAFHLAMAKMPPSYNRRFQSVSRLEKRLEHESRIGQLENEIENLMGLVVDSGGLESLEDLIFNMTQLDSQERVLTAESALDDEWIDENTPESETSLDLDFDDYIDLSKEIQVRSSRLSFRIEEKPNAEEKDKKPDS